MSILPPPTIAPINENGAEKVVNEAVRQEKSIGVIDSDDDIYRGFPPSPVDKHIHRPASVARSASTSSSSASSSSSSFIGRTLTTVIENAISRWARRKRRSSASSTTSSSSTSESSHTKSHFTPRRSKNRSSRSNSVIHSQRKPRQPYFSPREFVLFLPPTLSPHSNPAMAHNSDMNKLQEHQQRILRSIDASLVLAQLETALKKKAKLRRFGKKAGHAIAIPTILEVQEESNGPSAPHIGESMKGKLRQGDMPNPSKISSHGIGHAWWLDVTSPTWNDMHLIGKLLRLHPLTLEDILQQDPREKVETFPKLGYYFIVFRALKSQDVKPAASQGVGESEEVTRQEKGGPGPEKSATDPHVHVDEEAGGNDVKVVNLYLVIFKDGIVSFHFGDMSEHVNRVRERIFGLEGNAPLTSDWIAHGLLDSIVDAFFPLLNLIEDEVKKLDGLGNGMQEEVDGEITQTTTAQGVGADPLLVKSFLRRHWLTSRILDVIPLALRKIEGNLIESAIMEPISRHMRRVGRRNYGKRVKPGKNAHRSLSTVSNLSRMTTARRLVMTLNRLLVAKSEVVGRIHKRLIMSSPLRKPPITANYAEELSIYMSDVYDHILGLQQSFDHLEKILSHSHPAYLAFLRNQMGSARGDADSAFFALSVVTVSVALMQLIVGCFSVNVLVPRNGSRHNPTAPAPLVVFGVVLTLCILAVVLYGIVLRRWWKRADRRFQHRRRTYT